MVTLPAASAVNIPELLMLTRPLGEALQVTEEDRSAWLVSLKVPVAVICCVSPAATDAPLGVTPIEESVAGGGVMVNETDPLVPPEVAVTVTEPAACAVNMPELLMFTIPLGEALQATDEVRSFVLLSL